MKPDGDHARLDIFIDIDRLAYSMPSKINPA